MLGVLGVLGVLSVLEHAGACPCPCMHGRARPCPCPCPCPRQCPCQCMHVRACMPVHACPRMQACPRACMHVHARACTGMHGHARAWTAVPVPELICARNNLISLPTPRSYTPNGEIYRLLRGLRCVEASAPKDLSPPPRVRCFCRLVSGSWSLPRPEPLVPRFWRERSAPPPSCWWV